MRQLIIVVAALTIILSGCNQTTPTPEAKPNETTTPAPIPAPSTTTPPATGTTPPTTTPPVTPPVTTPTPTPTPVVEVPRPAGAKEQPVATTAQFEKVDFGMTYDEVGKIMGQIGKLTSESSDDSGVNKFQTYEYKKDAGGGMKVTFHNGKVSSKSESSV